MQIIIEGPDATGKSTLAEKVYKKYGMKQIIHSTSKTRNDYHYHADLLDYCEDCVFERFHIGEMVYPQIYGREGKLSDNDFFALNKKIVDNHAMMIILYTSDLSVLEDRLIERGELNYLEEIDQQNKFFMKEAYILGVYEDMLLKCVDISQPGAYEELDKWIDLHYGEVTPNIAYRNLCRDLVNKGHVMETKNIRGNTKELCNYSFIITNIEDPVLSLKTAECNYNYLAGEILWYWSSRNDLDFISKFSNMWAKVSDDGKSCNSAYGFLLKEKYGFNQIEKIIELLKVDPYSRRAVMNINVPNENVIETKDEPCTICLIYQIRDNRLHCTCVMRSNDLTYGLRNDLGFFLTLQRYIANRLDVGYGTYTHFAASIHVYDKDYEFAKKVATGTLDSRKERLDVDNLLANEDLLIDYVDNSWVNREEFTRLLSDKLIIREV